MTYTDQVQAGPRQLHRWRGALSTVYLIHFAHPLAGHAQHYIGSCVDVEARLRDHVNGHGARITQACGERDIELFLVRTWQGGRALERRLKRRKEAPRLCPVCNPRTWRTNAAE